MLNHVTILNKILKYYFLQFYMKNHQIKIFLLFINYLNHKYLK